MRVLIIDDEANIRKITGAALAAMGHETADAENGDAALKQLSAAHFDVAFLDWNLRNEQGLELLPRLLKTDPKLNIVICTGQVSRQNATAAKHAGAVDMVSKPFTPDDIRQVLGHISEGGVPPGPHRS